LKLDDEVTLEYYRIDKTSKSSIIMEEMREFEIQPATEAGMRRKKDNDKSPLSEIIETINDRFGTDFTETDRLDVV
jgi:type I restriction enzyme R subunit